MAVFRSMIWYRRYFGIWKCFRVAFLVTRQCDFWSIICGCSVSVLVVSSFEWGMRLLRNNHQSPRHHALYGEQISLFICDGKHNDNLNNFCRDGTIFKFNVDCSLHSIRFGIRFVDIVDASQLTIELAGECSNDCQWALVPTSKWRLALLFFWICCYGCCFSCIFTIVETNPIRLHLFRYSTLFQDLRLPCLRNWDCLRWTARLVVVVATEWL